MDMQVRQIMALKQQLVMTPKLQQALKLLQLPLLQLSQTLKAEMIANPMLEEVTEETPEEVEDADDVERQHQEDLAKWEEYFESRADDSADWGYARASREVREEFLRDQADVKTLHDHLIERLRFQKRPELELEIGEYIIHNLDDHGLLDMSSEEIAEKLDQPVELIEHVLTEAVQSLEPPGVGARSLQECLLIQLRELGREESIAWQIVQEHMVDLERHKLQQIARALRISAEEVREAVDEIATLEPRPGQVYASDSGQTVIPDLVIDRVDGEYLIYLNDREIPRLQVSHSYQKLISKGGGASKETKAYVLEKLNSANWLIKTIEQRRQTMLKVMNHIVKVQREFLDKGIAYMKPLTLADVADAIEMHESTVSRVTNGKYVQTPRGVFELKYFFGSSLASDGGGDVSSKAVKERILQLIRNEDLARPLSDQAIVELLKAEGLNIARRTVAKYRDQLRILPARVRKRV